MFTREEEKNNITKSHNNDVVISVRNVSKKFCKNLRRSMAYGIVDLSKNLLGIRQDSARLKKDEFWALDDINFKLRRGETLGLIGPNGSGKTTLLRLLAGIFPPDKGEIRIKGRIGALIAVGTGFHPHMTGRENIFLNGTILGMSYQEIKSKFDDIVDFAEVSDFLDAPVSTYSSGMRVRLGFSISIAIQPDILLVDEVLAVGDFNFQNKCFKKIDELKSRGVAIIIISHNFDYISRICSAVNVIYQGKQIYSGHVDEGIHFYKSLHYKIKKIVKEKSGFDQVRILHVSFKDASGNERECFPSGGELQINIIYEAEGTIFEPVFGIGIYNEFGQRVSANMSIYDQFNIDKISGKGMISIKIRELFLRPGYYKISVGVWHEDMLYAYDNKSMQYLLEVSGGKKFHAEAVCYMPIEWNIYPVYS